MKKPTVLSPCVAERHNKDDKSSRIIEFCGETEGQSGLINFKDIGDGTLKVELYRLDDGVKVDVDPKHLVRRKVNYNARPGEVIVHDKTRYLVDSTFPSYVMFRSSTGLAVPAKYADLLDDGAYYLE